LRFENQAVNNLRRGIQKIDKKSITYGKKYLPEDAAKAIDTFEKEIKSRIKKAGEI
jgi:BMFP domain-containing protein YqiC